MTSNTIYKILLWAILGLALSWPLIEVTWGAVVGGLAGWQLGIDESADAILVLRTLNWVSVTSLVSIVVFGVTGLLIGWMTKGVVVPSVIPALTLLTNNPLLRLPWTKTLSPVETIAIFLFAQVGTSILFGYLGARVRNRPRAESAERMPRER